VVPPLAPVGRTGLGDRPVRGLTRPGRVGKGLGMRGTWQPTGRPRVGLRRTCNAGRCRLG